MQEVKNRVKKIVAKKVQRTKIFVDKIMQDKMKVQRTVIFQIPKNKYMIVNQTKNI